MTKTSKCSIVATSLATIYVIYLVYLIARFFGATVSSEGGEALGGAIGTVLVMPHMIMFLIGAVFGWIGVFTKKPWAALVGAILYAVGTLFFLLSPWGGLPILVLGFIGYANQKKLNMQSVV